MYIFLDTETTGIIEDRNASCKDFWKFPRMVQIAYIIYNKDWQLIDQNEHIFKPDGYLIPAQASFIHKITTKRALVEGIELLPFLNDFKVKIDQCEYIIGHNIRFDYKVLGAEYWRSGIDNPLYGKKWICTMQKTTKFCGLGKFPSLSELYFKLFNCYPDNMHNAKSDIEAIRDCFFALRDFGVL